MTIRAVSGIPANVYSNAANPHPGGFKVHGETMLDWAVCKNLCLPSYKNTVFNDFSKLYYNHNMNRLEIVMNSGQIVASPTWTAIGNTNLLDQEKGAVLMTLVAEGLLSNEAQIPS